MSREIPPRFQKSPLSSDTLGVVLQTRRANSFRAPGFRASVTSRSHPVNPPSWYPTRWPLTNTSAPSMTASKCHSTRCPANDAGTSKARRYSPAASSAWSYVGSEKPAISQLPGTVMSCHARSSNDGPANAAVADPAAALGGDQTASRPSRRTCSPTSRIDAHCGSPAAVAAAVTVMRTNRPVAGFRATGPSPTPSPPVRSAIVVHRRPSSDAWTLNLYRPSACSQARSSPVTGVRAPRSACHHWGMSPLVAHQRVSRSPSTALSAGYWMVEADTGTLTNWPPGPNAPWIGSNRHVPTMGSTAGLPGRTFATSTGAADVSGTGTSPRAVPEATEPSERARPARR